MNDFWTDVQEEVLSYYNQVVDLLPRLLLGVFLFVLFWMLASRLKSFAKRRLTARMDDPLLASFIARFLKTTIVILGFLVLLRVVGLGSAAASVLAGAGISAFIIGFAFKDIGENFLAGILMAFKRPFRVGDIVETGDVKGTIVGLSLRDTQIKTFDGRDVYVPNGMILKNPIFNYTIDGYMRQEFVIGLDYGSNLQRAGDVILQTLPKVNGVLTEDKAPSIMISELGASTINVTVYYWLDTFDKSVNGIKVKNEAIEQVLLALDQDGFNMPSDIIEIKNYKGEPLRQGA